MSDKSGQDQDIDFNDDRDGCLFTVTVHRKLINEVEAPKSSPESSSESSPKTENQIIELIQQDPFITTEQLGKAIGITKRAILKQIHKLKNEGRLKRVGSNKSGQWEIL